MRFRAGFFPLLLALAATMDLRAATSDGSLRMEVITAYNFVVDSNIESPAGKSPSAAHLGVKVHNDGATALTNVVVNIGDLINPSTGTGTPGVFESRTVDVAGQYAGTFELQMPGGAADAVRVIPRIEPGQHVVQYFFVTYPLKDSLGRSVTGSAPVPEDDLWLNYDVWASAYDGVASRRVDKTTKVTMRNEISAMANKIWPNGDNKVPDEYLSVIESFLGWRPSEQTPRIPGAEVKEGIWYDLGNVGAGFDNNGDGIPDRNAWLQPVGDPTQFSPLGSRMVKCYGIVVVKLNDGSEQLIPFEDRLYFENLPADNTGAVGLVYYEFLPLNTSLPGNLTPYQEVASGYDNEKFNADYGTVTGVAVLNDPEAEIVKTGPATCAIGQNADYTLTATNTGDVRFGWPELGLPVVIEDPIPTGLHYVSGTAVAGPNVTTPAGGVFTVYYSTNNGSTWTATEPSPASSVNRLRWVLDRALDPGNTATVRFSATVPVGFTDFNFTNIAILKTGTETEVDRDQWTTVLTGNNSVGDFVWRDLDRDGIQDGGAETGIANIGVSLYVDVNGDGLLDGGDQLYGTTSTNGSGLYLFSNLPDRKYIVQVDAVDADVPNGFTLKQGVAAAIAVDLDSTASNPSPVNILTADWPFIDALEVRKSVSPTVYNEGDLITYTVDLENHMSTVAPVQPPIQTQWITSATQNAQASGNTLVSNTTGAPNNVYGFTDWNSNSDVITTNGLGTFTSTTGAISKVEILVRGYMSRALLDDAVAVSLTNNGTVPSSNSNNAFTSIPTATLNTTVGTPQTIAVDVTGFVVGTWSWTQAQNIRAALIASKQTNSDRGDFYIDAIGVRVTASTTSSGTAGPNTINPLPLYDTYDPSKLQFVSASVQPDSTSPAGTLSWLNLGPLNPGARRTITVTFSALAPPDSNGDGRRDPTTTTNTITATNAYFVSGLPAGGGESSVDVTINPRGTIGDFVYWDVDGNGGFGTGDVPLSGVIVQLWQRSGASYVFTGSTAITNSSGFYSFTGLADVTSTNAYQVRIVTDTANDLYTLPFNAPTTTQFPSGGSTTAQTGYVTGPDIVLNNSDTITTNDANLLQDFGFDSNLASLISGKLFRDWNGNGVQDPGEEPLVGYTINLTVGATTTTTTTDANGFYQFLNITTTGNHTVTVASPPAGHSQTLDPDATFNSNTVVNVVAGNAYLNRDFAYRPTGSLTIGDTVYYDWNGNGAQDPGESGIPNVDVLIYEDANADGVINAEDANFATVTTNASGFYQFTGLAAGNLIVRVVTTDPDFPPSFNQTQDFDGSLDNQAKVNLTASINTVDFGYQPVGTASIGNLVWLDTNNDGLKGTGENGIDGVTVQLFRNGQIPGTDTPVSSATTSGGGFYSFANLPSGGYFVYIPASNFITGGALASQPWSSTTTNTGDNQTDLDDNGIQAGLGQAVTSPLITLSSGESDPTVDFGFTGRASIGDTVFYDLNANGSLDYSETGINGVTVELYLDANQDDIADGPFIATTTTTTVGGVSGFYQFTDIAPGNYIVKVRVSTLPAGLSQTADPDLDGIPVNNTDGDPDNNGDHADTRIILFSGSNYTGADFGYQPPGSIGDYVWLDVDRDGVQDAGEPGIAGVVVSITNGTTTYNVTTDADGYWAQAVADGNWTVSIPTAPLGKVPTYDADSGITSPDASVAVTVSGGLVTLPAGLAQGNLGLDFGYALDGDYSLSGTVAINDSGITGKHNDIDDFYDDGADFDAGPSDETELSGILVYLYSTGGTFLGSTYTDAGGNYLFTDLPDGGYRVIIGTTAAPLDRASLTTTNGNYTDGTTVTNTGTTVIQQVAVSGASLYDIDFMFDSDVNYDFGDLPASYAMTSLTQDGARHIVPEGGATLYLGGAPDVENNGTPSLTAGSDDSLGSDDENGVTFSTASWINGTGTGSATVQVTGNGWLVAWIDWNQDGDLLDAGEMIANRAVSTGSTPLAFDIPAGTITGGNQSWFARFRLFPSQPAFPLFAYVGEAAGGEVEDHLVAKTSGGSIGDLVWVDADGDGVIDSNESGLGGVNVELRNNLNQLVASQTTSDGSQDVDGDGVIDPAGYYRFRDLASGTYTVIIPTTPAGYNISFDENDGTSGPDGNTGVVLGLDQQHLTADFGYQPQLASIAGQVRFDTDSDGDLMDPDAGAAFVRIQLWTDPDGDGNPADGVQIAETFTNQDGDYLFGGVPTGKYAVVEINPAGASSTADVDGGNPDRIAVTMVGVDITGRDFLDTLPPLYTISGTAYEDNNLSGDMIIGVDDYPVAGIWIRLYLDRNGDGLANDGDPEIGAVLTNTQGFYSFAGLQPGNYAVVQTDPPDSTSIWDAQGAPADNLIAVTITASDVIERDFLDNNALGGLSGTVRADTNGDGNADVNLAGVSLALLDASGDPVLDALGNPRNTTTNAAGFYLFTDLIAGVYQVAETQPSGYGSLSDKDGGNPDLIGDQETIAVSNGSINTGNDFLELLQACPDLWTAWQDKWNTPLNGATGLADNPDGDRYSNLIEYAFCLPPHSGMFKPFCLVSSESVAGAVDGVFSRTAGAAKDITYILEWSAALGNPTVWTGSVVLDGTNTVVTNNGTGKEIVRIIDLASVTGLTGASGFVRMRVELDNGVTQADDTTEVLGWVKTPAGLCCTTYNDPFLHCAVFTGTVDQVDGQDLVLTNSSGPINLSAALQVGVSYYIEVASGDNEGQRFDVVSAASDRITLANDASVCAAGAPYNTLTGAPPQTMAGDSIVLRPHRTLGGLFPVDAFGATGTQTTADEFQMFAGSQWTIYWAYDDNGTPRWVDGGDAGMADMASAVIQPGYGMFFNNRTAPVTLLSFGEVRENRFIRNLCVSHNLIGGGFPVSQSPVGRSYTIGTGFLGTLSFKSADSLFVWNSDQTPGNNTYTTYYLAHGAPTQPTFQRWVKMGDGTLTIRDNETLLLRDRSVFMRVDADHHGHVETCPWTP